MAYTEKFLKKYDEVVTEPMAKVKGFKEYYFSGIMDDTAGFCGTELHRRTVGMANNIDVTTIRDEKKRLLAERLNIYAGKEFIKNQASFRTGAQYVDAVRRATRKAEETLQ